MQCCHCGVSLPSVQTSPLSLCDRCKMLANRGVQAWFGFVKAYALLPVFLFGGGFVLLFGAWLLWVLLLACGIVEGPPARANWPG